MHAADEVVWFESKFDDNEVSSFVIIEAINLCYCFLLPFLLF